MSELEVRPIRATEVEAVLDLLAPWQSREFFARYVHGDPAFEPGHVCAAFAGGAPISCAQILPRTIRVVGGTARAAGIGQVWTRPDYRRRGIAPRVLRCCVDVMRAERFGLSLMFASRFEFYESVGWRRYTRRRLAVSGAPAEAPAARIRPFDPAADLAAVRALYDAYAAPRPGPTVRDADAWRGSLQMAGNPTETFLVATDAAGAIVAYMRGVVDDAYVVSELALAPDQAPAGAALLAAHASLAAEGGHRFVVLDDPDDAALRAAVEAAGFTVTPVTDPFIMWRVVDPAMVPGGAPGGADSPEAELALLHRLLPPERYVFWHADRF